MPPPAAAPPLITRAGAIAHIDSAKAVIFDNDGTLVDSMPAHYLAWKAALAEHALHFSAHQFYAMAGMTASKIIKTLADEQAKPSVSVDAVMQSRQTRLAQVLKSVSAVAPVVDLLNYAISKQLPVAVASGSERPDVLATLEAAGIDVSVFGAVVTCEDVANGKPHPDTFLLAAKKLGVEPHDCIGLEDGDKGLLALDAAGMDKLDVRLLEGYPLPDISES